MSIAISIRGVSKSYKQVRALNDISFEVNQGELFGLIGPDGAGKTSLIRILATLLLPDQGNATVTGYDIKKQYRLIRPHIGYMPGEFALYQDLTVEENLRFFATVFGTNIRQNYDLIKPIYEQIEPFRHRRAGKLSGGMKQKLALSCALIHRPKVLLLDEPTTGVDAVSRQEFWEMLQDMKLHGITVLVSTPYMDEAILCDRVALIQKGAILDIDTPLKITQHFTRKLVRLKAKDKYKLIQDLRRIELSESVYPFGEYTHMTLKDDDVDLDEIRSILLSYGNENIIAEYAEPGIEDRFIELMK
jgi:ABC-type multidrug transport system ATPase subunit